MNPNPKAFQKLPSRWSQNSQANFKYEGSRAKRDTKDPDATREATKQKGQT